MLDPARHDQELSLPKLYDPLTEVDRNLFWRRQFLNPFAFEGAPKELVELVL